MKIAQVAPFFHPHIGGVESHVLTLSQKLIQKGHDLTVYTSMHRELPEKDSFQGVRIVRVKQWGNLFQTPITPDLKRILASGDFDIIHAHTPPPLTAYYAAKSRRRSKTPFVITFHCDLELPKLVGKVATAIYHRTLGRYTFRRADKIIVHTKTYGATSRAIWESDPAVIPSAVNPKRFDKDLDASDIIKKHGLEGKKIVLFVGRIVQHKGVDYLVDSALEMDDEIRYVLVGEGEYLERLRKRISDRKLQNKVILTGRVSYSDLPKYFAACDVFILPSISRLEAFGLVVLEAMASEKPVIVSTIPGVMELVTEGENGLHAEPMNSNDIAEKIKTLLSDADLGKRMGEAGRKMVERDFNWDKVAHQVEEVYSDLVRS